MIAFLVEIGQLPCFPSGNHILTEPEWGAREHLRTRTAIAEIVAILCTADVQIQHRVSGKEGQYVADPFRDRVWRVAIHGVTNRGSAVISGLQFVQL